MFDSMKNLGALAGLMKNQDKIKTAGERVRTKLEATRVTGEAGAGAARAIVTGTLKVVSVELAPALVMGMASDAKTHELASSLIAEAVNNALAQAQLKMKEAIDVEAKDLGIDGLIPNGGLGGLLGN
jgi:DNA-binding protein YbaB